MDDRDVAWYWRSSAAPFVVGLALAVVFGAMLTVMAYDLRHRDAAAPTSRHTTTGAH
jgi:hypothetical protein